MSTRFLIAALASTMLASAANAATFFTSAGAFNAATSGLTTGNFEGLVAPTGFTSAPSFTVSGVNFNSAGSDFIIGGQFFGGTIYNAVPFYSGQFAPGNVISFAGATAFGMTYGSYAGNSGPISFTLSDGSVFSTTLPTSSATPVFFGFTSTAPITSITVNNQVGGSQVFDVLSFSIGSAAVVPEPQSWALLIAGFGLTGAALRRRRAAIA
jgi:hypothetical protein